MQKKKNTTLFIVFLILLAWTIVYFNLENKSSGISFDESMFSIEDTAAVHKISIRGEGISNVLSRGTQNWTVNDIYPMDPSMQKVLMSVLHQVKVKRTVPRNDLDRIKDDILANGYKVEVSDVQNGKTVFYAGGNGISLSYFMKEDNIPYIVHLPGYESYVTGIFEVHENDWRDRVIFQTSWLGLKSYILNYTDDPGNNIHISADNNLYSIEGIAKIDTTTLMNYLDEVSFFYTDQYIDQGQISLYDSLRNTKPFAQLLVNSLGMKVPVRIDFFRQLDEENVMLGLLNENQMCLFNAKRIQVIFQEKDHFRYK